MLSATLSLRQKAYQKAGENIIKAQKKQQRDYNRRHTIPTSLKAKDKIWLKNQRRLDKKDGKFSYKWHGPYIVESISKKGPCTFRNQGGVELSKKYNVAFLKPYIDPVNPVDNENKDDIHDEKPPNLQDAEPHKPDLQSLESVLQKDSNSSAYHHVDAQTDINSNAWSKLPHEIVEKIIILSVRSSDEVISTFNKLSLTCSRFSTLLKRRSHYLLPRVHLQFSSEDFKKADKYNGKIKAGVRKIVKFFREFCGASLFISEVIKDKKWKSACFFWNLRNTQCTIFVISLGKALKLVLLIPL